MWPLLAALVVAGSSRAQEVPVRRVDESIHDSFSLIEALGWWTPPAASSPGAEKWAVLIAAAATLSAAFAVRWQYTRHPMRFVVEMVVTCSVVAAAFSEYLHVRAGPQYELVFLHCVGLEMLLGFDNVLDVVGWYAHAKIPYAQAATLILAGAFAQTVVRLPLFPLLASWSAGSAAFNQSTAYFLILLALRNIYLAFASKQLQPWSFFGFFAAKSFSLPVRVLLAETTALLCDVDAFVAKSLITSDAFAITASSVIALGLLRVVAMLLLLYVHEDVVPMYIMWGLSGSLMLTMALHELWPVVPAIPAIIRMMIPAVLYTYTVGVAVCLWRAHPRKGELAEPAEKVSDAPGRRQRSTDREES